MVTIRVIKRKDPITFKDLTYNPSVVEVVDLMSGARTRFEGVENARRFLRKLGYSSWQ